MDETAGRAVSAIKSGRVGGGSGEPEDPAEYVSASAFQRGRRCGLTYVRVSQIPWEAMETRKEPALIKKKARYPAVNTTVHHEVKSRNLTRSR